MTSITLIWQRINATFTFCSYIAVTRVKRGFMQCHFTARCGSFEPHAHQNKQASCSIVHCHSTLPWANWDVSENNVTIDGLWTMSSDEVSNTASRASPVSPVIPRGVSCFSVEGKTCNIWEFWKKTQWHQVIEFQIAIFYALPSPSALDGKLQLPAHLSLLC